MVTGPISRRLLEGSLMLPLMLINQLNRLRLCVSGLDRKPISQGPNLLRIGGRDPPTCVPGKVTSATKLSTRRDHRRNEQ
eukprot:5163391-Pleurochrysis_carterae.AAC.1